jgi:hypothetical protein
MTTHWIEPELIGHEQIDRERKLCFKLADEFMQSTGLSERENCVIRLIEQLLDCFASEEAVREPLQVFPLPNSGIGPILPRGQDFYSQGT